MPRPDQTPQLPKLPFLLGDAALLATATFIASTSPHPLATTPLLAIVGCVGLGAIIGVVPFLTDYARKQDEALDERQRTLEALAATVTTSAEQIGIAATGLHEITELVHKNLRAADQLPHKLQEKIGEFTAQLTNARADETEELEKSLAELRASESERLAATAEKISKTAADLAKLEASAQKHLAAASESLAQLAASSGRHFSELGTATAAAIARAQAAATIAIDEKIEAADLALSTARLTLLAELDVKLAAITAALASAPSLSSTPVPFSQPKPEPLNPEPFSRPVTTPSENSEPETRNPESSTVSPAAPRKRAPKKSVPPFAIEPPPPPVAETVATPEPGIVAPTPSVIADEFVQFSPDEIPAPAFQLEPTSPHPEPPQALSVSNGETLNSEPAAEAPTPTVSSDGATRLLVTAYIGIGNRLFIRGAGPGLSWEKGVPLQFVSIGKWRWETTEATAPIAYQLYKNDALECSALGEQTLTPGNQQEVAATF